MAIYSQLNRPLRVKTPLGDDAVLPVGFSGTEGLSQLFCFDLDLLAPHYTDVDFSKLLGQSVTVELSGPLGETRYFNGIVRSLEEGLRDNEFTSYKAQLVPQMWLTTKRFRSRIFQQKSVPEILETVFQDLTTSIELSGTYRPRNYCVQYQESDFAFASRLMEEEGIFYYFRHEQDKHTLVITDGPYQLKDLPDISTVLFDPLEGGLRETACVFAWRKRQEICAGQVTLWDYHFELPGKNLEATATIQQTVQVGQVTHKLPGTEESLEIYEFPGRYAQRYDGIDPGGAQRPADLQNIYTDNMQTAKVAIEAQAAHSLDISGQSNVATMCPGLKFTLERHPNADGKYLLVQVEHRAELPSSYQADTNATGFSYENRFTCLPDGLPFRPKRITPRPRIVGLQTATVVGPSGDHMFLDRYGRVKVQFHWDREGKSDGNSSCWLRVAQPWAGQGWGAFFWPRIGHEVLVSFLEGDPDRPVVVGSVYNAHNMPPLEMPKLASACGFKSCSVGGDPSKNFNCVIFYDSPGDEHVHIHSETHQCITSETANFQRTYGPRIEVYGVMPLGGGGGGGEVTGGDETTTVPCTTPPESNGHGNDAAAAHAEVAGAQSESSGGGGGLVEWATFLGKYLHEKDYKDLWKMFCPSSLTVCLGSTTSSALAGDDVTRVLGGARNNFVVDIAGIAADWIPPSGTWPTLLGGGGAALLNGLRGNNSMVVGPGNTLQYFNALKVRRGKEYRNYRDRFSGDVGDKAALVLVLLTIGAYATCDICTVIKSTPKQEDVRDNPEWLPLAFQMAGERAQALLTELERQLAAVSHAEDSVAQAMTAIERLRSDLTNTNYRLEVVEAKFAEDSLESAEDAILSLEDAPRQGGD